MDGESRPQPQYNRRWGAQPHRQLAPGERRRSERVPISLAFDVYDRCRYLGRFWSRNLSQEGLFLKAPFTESLERTILSLRFWADGVERCLRGTAVHGIPGQGVGIQLAFWRLSDHADHSAFRQIVHRHSPTPLAQS